MVTKVSRMPFRVHHILIDDQVSVDCLTRYYSNVSLSYAVHVHISNERHEMQLRASNLHRADLRLRVLLICDLQVTSKAL